LIPDLHLPSHQKPDGRSSFDEQRRPCALRTGSAVIYTVHLLKGDYPTGRKAPKNYKKNMRIAFDEELPAWNYRAVPTKQGS
jgi:hypothetical protein